MILDIVQPVGLSLLDKFQDKSPHIFGNNIRVHHPIRGLPDLQGVQIAFFTVAGDGQFASFSELRYALYHLFVGNWDVTVADLGILPSGDLIETENQVTELCEYILKKGIVPIILGGSKNILYGIYRAFDNVKKGIRLLTVDSKFDFDVRGDTISPHTYMNRIITKDPLNLFDLVNLGYQTYYVAQEEIDLMNKMLFDTHRLGAITSDITSTEHLIRNVDIMSIDVLGSVKASDLGLTDRGLPNGFTSKELCALSRYAGISTSVSAFSLLGCPDGYISSQLIAQAIWYFIEGYNYREVEMPSIGDPLYERYTVSLDYHNISFYKSLKTMRWWIEFTEISGCKSPILFPCSHKDYLDACEGVLPQTWERVYSKLINYHKND